MSWPHILDLPQTITATRLIARGCDPATAIRVAAGKAGAA